MASENRPGVEVSQEISQSATVVASPSLVPLVVGVCNQIIEALDDDGALNSDALYSAESYNQADMSVPQASLPDPRSNIDELDVAEDSLYAYLYFGGVLSKLSRGTAGDDEYGQAFLRLANFSTQPGFLSTESDSFTFDSTVGDTLTLAFDVVNPTDTSEDVVVTLMGTLTTAEVVAAINTAAAADVAEVFTDSGGDISSTLTATYVSIKSTNWGATASVTIRAGTSALPILFGSGFTATSEYRIEGSGWRGQDDEDGDLSTPWIEFYRGEYSVDGTDTTFPTMLGAADSVIAVLHDADGELSAGKASAVTFTGTGATIPLSAATGTVPGDQFWADGTQVGSGEVIKVETSRFRLGRINTSRSTYSAAGVATNRVYDALEVNTENAGVPFAPKYAYFIADGLQYGSVTPEGVQATLTGALTGLDERAAQVVSSADITFPVSLASLTLIFQVVEDSVDGDEVVYTFAGGPYANIAALVSALSSADEFSQLTVSSAGDRLLLSTTKSGAGQGLTIKTTGTANVALGFSTSSATTDTGKDHEFAEQAEAASDTITLPLADLTSVPLDLVVSDSKGTHTLSASGVDLSSATTLGDVVDAIAVAFGGTASSDLTLYAGGDASGEGGIAVATVYASSSSADSGTVSIVTVEGGAEVTLELTAVDGSDGFRQLGFYDATNGSPAEIDSTSGTAYPIGALSGATIAFTYDDGSAVTVTGTGSSAMASATGAAALAVLLNADAALNGITASSGTRLVHWFSDDDDVLSVRSIEGGASVHLQVASGQAGFAAMGFNVTTNVDEVGTDSQENSDSTGTDTLKGTTLVFSLDDNPYEYGYTFASASLQDGIDGINELVDGSTDVASESSAALTLTSILAGAASRVLVNLTDSTGAAILGFSSSAYDSAGSGRPNPDSYVDGAGSLNIGPNILRNRSSGIPYSLESAVAPLYIAYTALRLDVTASADDAALLEFEDVETMETAIGPISTANPLALGTFIAMANAPSVAVTAFGVDEISSAAPEGTLDGWARALEFLESSEVYAMAPLAADPYIQGLVVTHVTSMSQPAERGERVALIWTPNRTRAADTIVSSGEDGETNGTDNSFTLDANPGSSLISAGVDPSDPVAYSDQLYLELVVVSGGSQELRRYSVSEVNGVVLTLRTTFTSSQNTDGFFSTTTLDVSLEHADWTLKIRGDTLVVAGTTIPDYGTISDAMADEGEAYANRRVVYFACDSVDTSINGLTQNVEGYFAAAAWAGMTAELSPQQPFTHLPLAGIGRVYGTDDTFSESQLDTIADGGRNVLVNFGGKVVSRHQRTTATSSVEYREFSITKAIDYIAKGLRQTNRVFIGRSVITSGFLDQLTMSNEGYLDYVELLGVVRRAQLSSLLQSTESPDTVLIEVEVQPVYPCNKIKITIVS